MNDNNAYMMACEKIAEELASTTNADDYSWGTSLDNTSIVNFMARVSMNDVIVLSCRKDSVFIKNLMRKVKKIAADSSATAETRCRQPS